MPRPRKLPDADVLHDLRIVQGKTYEEIANAYGVTRAAVHLALQRSNLVTPRPRYFTEIPWRVSVEHSNNYHLAMLRLAAREKHGLPVPDHKVQYLHNWMDSLRMPRERAPHGVVVDYHEGYKDGFATVPREPKIDRWLIREPRQKK